ncbi:MAG TPA: FxLYD domain-containing protein [bacterium]|nr:FxLYD domain-containing protein [bacterium]
MARIVFLLGLCAVLLAGCAATGSTSGSAAQASGRTTGRDASGVVKVTNTHFVLDSAGTVDVEGTVANHAATAVGNVVLSARVYGNSGQVLGEGVVALTEPIPARRSRSFRITMHNVKRGQRAALTASVVRAEYFGN